MFHPKDNPMERGWVGRLDGDRVLHLAAQTLQSFFIGGGGAREHAEYALADVTLLVPVQHPPTMRMFSADGSFRFANATAVIGPNTPVAGGPLSACARIAAVIGAGGAIGAFSALLEWQDPAEQPTAKQSDFGIVLGPSVVTPDEFEPSSVVWRLRADGRHETGVPDPFSWAETISLAARRTVLRPGDVIAGPPVAVLAGIAAGVQFEVEGIGTLDCPVA
jgi:fumarylacetoacetate (FAA) hydrolase